MSSPARSDFLQTSCESTLKTSAVSSLRAWTCLINYVHHLQVVLRMKQVLKGFAVWTFDTPGVKLRTCGTSSSFCQFSLDKEVMPMWACWYRSHVLTAHCSSVLAWIAFSISLRSPTLSTLMKMFLLCVCGNSSWTKSFVAGDVHHFMLNNTNEKSLEANTVMTRFISQLVLMCSLY